MNDPQPQPVPEAQNDPLAALGIGAQGAQTNSYTLDTFLPILLNLLVPRRALSSAPTFTPKTFVDSIQLYDDGSIVWLYIYASGQWNSIPLATAVTSLIAGDGILLSPSEGTGDVTVTNTGVLSLLEGSNITITPDGLGGYTIAASYPPSIGAVARLATRVGNAASGSQAIAHGLGKTPTLVRVTAVYGSTTPILLQSVGTYDGTNTRTVMSWTLVGSTGGADNDTSNIVNLSMHDGSNTQSAAVSGLDATNLTLNWTKAGSGLGSGSTNINLLVEAFG